MSTFSDIFHHVRYFSQGCFEPIRLNGFVVVVVVVDRIGRAVSQTSVVPLGKLTRLPCCYFRLCVCEVI